MKKRFLLLFLILLFVFVYSIIADDQVTTDFLCFTVPNSLEIQSNFYKDLKDSFIQDESSNIVESVILQPKGLNNFNQEVLNKTYCRIIIEIEKTDEFIDNKEFVLQLLQASESEKRSLSQILEFGVSQAINMKRFYDVTSQEIGGLYSWRTGYDRGSTGLTDKGDVHVDKYLVRDGNISINITTSYRISEKSQWLPVIEDFLRNNLLFKGNLTDTQKNFDILKSFSLYSSKDKFLWYSEPQWMYENLGIPEIPNAKMYSINSSSFEVSLLKGYTIGVSVIVGLEDWLLFSAFRSSYIVQSESELLTSLKLNNILADLQIESNESNYKKNLVKLNYSYSIPFDPIRISGISLIRITKDRKVVFVSAEWFSPQSNELKRIIESIEI